MTNKLYELRKWGNGSSSYEVSYAVDYNSISQRAIYTTLGQVNKEGNAWVGIMTGVRFVNTPMITGKTRKEVIEKMTAIFNEPQVTELPKCMMCGNTDPEEVVEMEMFSDGEGNEETVIEHICGEDVGCNKPDPQVVCDGCGGITRESRVKVTNGWKDCEECQEYHDVKNEVDEYVHTSPRVDRKGMYTADIYNATQDRFYATVTWSTLNGLRQKLNETLSKLNAGESL